jgi:hypothetical protein
MPVVSAGDCHGPFASRMGEAVTAGTIDRSARRLSQSRTAAPQDCRAGARRIIIGRADYSANVPRFAGFVAS